MARVRTPAPLSCSAAPPTCAVDSNLTPSRSIGCAEAPSVKHNAAITAHSLLCMLVSRSSIRLLDEAVQALGVEALGGMGLVGHAVLARQFARALRQLLDR